MSSEQTPRRILVGRPELFRRGSDLNASLLSPLPHAAMHKPGEVSQFVEGYLTKLGESPREIKLQVVGIKALQNPGLIRRFLHDFVKSKEASSYRGKLGVFLIDDSWDDTVAEQIRAVAEEHEVGYYRVRDNAGFARKFTDKFAEALKKNLDLTEEKRTYLFWLGRALLKDGLKVPLANIDAFTFTDPLTELGGIAGTQNFGYLVAAYEAGKQGVQLHETTITINEDDQRYRTLSQKEGGLVDVETHDIFAEREAWFKDPQTAATVGRYTGHTGNPVSLVRDTLAISSQILTERSRGQSSTYQLFDPETTTFREVTTEEAYQHLPQILVAAAQRQPIIGLWMKQLHYTYSGETMNWQAASHLDLGNVTLTGESVKTTLTPLCGVLDYNFSGLLRARAVMAADPNRVIRREEPLMHHRAPRVGGGDALGVQMVGAFNNRFAKEQMEISEVISTDDPLRARMIEAFGLSPGEEVFSQVFRTFEDDKKLQEIKDLRQLLATQVSLTRQSDTDTQDPVTQSLEDFLEHFPEEAIAAIESDLYSPASPKEITDTRQGVRRFIEMYKIWPDLIEIAYEMGREEQKKEMKESPTSEEPIEVGYLPGISAHTARPLEVALELSNRGIAARMRGSRKGRHVFPLGEDFTTDIGTVSVGNSDEYYFHPGELIRGESSVAEMSDNVHGIVERLRTSPPPFVLVDHNVPLLMAAKLAGVPTVTITNMSNVGFTSQEFIDVLGSGAQKVAEGYYRSLDPKLREVYRQTYLRDRGKEPIQDMGWFQLMEKGDLTLIADNEAFVKDGLDERFNLDPRLRQLVGSGEYVYVGSIQPNTFIEQHVDQKATQQAVSTMEAAREAGKKVILGSFGSTNKQALYSALIDIGMYRPDLMVLFTTADTDPPGELPSNLVSVPFANLPELAKHADVLLSHGGSGTLYPFIKEGRGGIVTITTNADHLYNAKLIEQHGLGKALPIADLNGNILKTEIEQMLVSQDMYAARLAELAPKISLRGAETAAEVIIRKFNL